MPESNADQKDIYTENVLLPFETQIYYWKILARVQIVAMAVIIIGGIALGFKIYDKINQYVVFWYFVGGIIASYLGYIGFTRIYSKAQIIINEDGIETLTLPLLLGKILQMIG